MSLSSFSEGTTVPLDDFSRKATSEKGFTNKSLGEDGLSALGAPACTLLSLDNSASKGNEADFLYASGYDQVGLRVETEAENLGTCALSECKRSNDSTFCRGLSPFKYSDYLVIVQGRGYKELAICRESHVFDSLCEWRRNKYLTLHRFVVPNTDAGLRADLACSANFTSRVHGDAVDIIRMVQEVLLGVCSWIHNDTDSCSYVR